MSPETQKFFQKIIKERLGVDSRYVETNPVQVEWEGKTYFSGLVHTFQLIDHPDSKFCFTWNTLDVSAFRQGPTWVIPDRGKLSTAKQAAEVYLMEMERKRREDKQD